MYFSVILWMPSLYHHPYVVIIKRLVGGLLKLTFFLLCFVLLCQVLFIIYSLVIDMMYSSFLTFDLLSMVILFVCVFSFSQTYRTKSMMCSDLSLSLLHTHTKMVSVHVCVWGGGVCVCVWGGVCLCVWCLYGHAFVCVFMCECLHACVSVCLCVCVCVCEIWFMLHNYYSCLLEFVVGTHSKADESQIFVINITGRVFSLSKQL